MIKFYLKYVIPNGLMKSVRLKALFQSLTLNEK